MGYGYQQRPLAEGETVVQKDKHPKRPSVFLKQQPLSEEPKQPELEPGEVVPEDEEPAEYSPDSVFTDETADVGDEAGADVVEDYTDLYDRDKEPPMEKGCPSERGKVRKGIAEKVTETIDDLAQAAREIREIQDVLEERTQQREAEEQAEAEAVDAARSEAVEAARLDRTVVKEYRRLALSVSKQRGWTRGSRRKFWEQISRGEPGGHAACAERMRGKVDDPHAFCAWAEHEGTGRWPAEKSADGLFTVIRRNAGRVREVLEGAGFVFKRSGED